MVLDIFSYNSQNSAKVSPCILSPMKSQFDRIREGVGGLFGGTFHSSYNFQFFEFFFKDRRTQINFILRKIKKGELQRAEST